MTIENCLDKNCSDESQNFTFVSSQTLEMALPERQSGDPVEYTIHLGPKRRSQERKALEKTLFFEKR